MIIADFTGGNIKAYTQTLFQYDKGQRLGFKGIEYPENSEVHFSNDEKDGISYAVKIKHDSVKIPDAFLATGNYIYAWLYANESHAGTSGKVDYHFEDDPVDPQPDDRFVVDKVSSSKKAFNYSMTLYEIVIPVKKRPNIFEFKDESDDGEDDPEPMEIEIHNENAVITNTGNDGAGNPTIQNYTIEGENLKFI